MKEKSKVISRGAIRTAGRMKIDELVKATEQLKQFRTAFAEWQAGEVFVGKTGVYRYRHGKRSMTPTPWSERAAKTFSSPAAFAFAAFVLSAERSIKPAEPKPAARANVIELAKVMPAKVAERRAA
jgi:hypothetical protein